MNTDYTSAYWVEIKKALTHVSESNILDVHCRNILTWSWRNFFLLYFWSSLFLSGPLACWHLLQKDYTCIKSGQRFKCCFNCFLLTCIYHNKRVGQVPSLLLCLLPPFLPSLHPPPQSQRPWWALDYCCLSGSGFASETETGWHPVWIFV